MAFFGPSTSELGSAPDRRANGNSPSTAKKSLLDAERLQAASRNSSQSSIKDCDKRSNRSEKGLLQAGDAMKTVEFCRDSWDSLCSHGITLQRSEIEVSELRRLLEEDHAVLAAISNREVTSIKQNSELIVHRLAQKVAEMRKRVNNKKRGGSAMRQEITQGRQARKNKLSELNMEIEELEEKCAASEIDLARLRPRLLVLRELLKHRQRQMMEDVIDIFRIRIRDAPSVLWQAAPSCSCAEKHYIRNVHLPWTTKLPGHDDRSLTAGFALLVQMVEVVSKISNSHLRYALSLSPAGGEIRTSDGNVLSLVSNARNKGDRARLDAAATLLLRNLAQLRSDCGVHTKRMERALFVMDDLMRMVARGERGEVEAAFSRPYDCSYSIASLMERLPDTEKSVVVLNRHIPTVEDEEPSFLSHGVEAEEDENKK